jgi:ATP-dependent RNA helicase SUPV3L1/SUV3
VVVEGHKVGHIAGFAFLPDPLAVGPEKRLVQRAARRSLREEMPRRVGLLEAAPDAAFTLTADHSIQWGEAPVARLRPGASLTRPAVEVIDSEFLDGPQRERLRIRLQAFVDGLIARDLAPLFMALVRGEGDAALRGPLHRMAEAGGVVAGGTDMDIAPALRGRLKAIGVRAGRFALYVPDLLKPRAAALRGQLWAVAARAPAAPEQPNPGLVSIPLAEPGSAQYAFLTLMGWVPAGPVLLRLDIAERIAAELAFTTRGRPAPVPLEIGQRLGVRADLVPAILRGLGLRILPVPALAPAVYGPPPPPMVAQPRRRAVVAEPVSPARPDHPFAALAALRR